MSTEIVEYYIRLLGTRFLTSSSTVASASLTPLRPARARAQLTVAVPDDKVDLSLKRDQLTDHHKPSVYSFYSPSDPDYYKLAVSILIPLGEYFQIQDNHRDYAEDRVAVLVDPSYAADMNSSLFADKTTAWDVAHRVSSLLVQNSGDFAIKYLRGYHVGINMGFNYAESVKFALNS
ncbi:hypothetical protein FA95DRAFT_1610990 [Auriscalpium vulgare]|uniref:Uncharacterized protein n=2 Tax=Auriscalpium vulgare TaxID=40419 RepID=A0ACB8R183_9AGAM|nr:hypothetical protein FA95DRAFT_1614104 [Auriscalpium vulgare]KAI0041457.1 hypothetical protein FA95DRAFT_1610990 [Auriscalpium vulgare]